MNHPTKFFDSGRRVSVIGLGKLGTPIAAAYASKGHEVFAVDVNPRVVAELRCGRSDLKEPGLSDLLKQVAVQIQAQTDIESAILGSEMSFLIVPTPSRQDGSFSTDWILDACFSIGSALRVKNGYHVVVIISTVLPGAVDDEVIPKLEEISGRKCGSDFGVCYSPEFVALGSVIRDVLNPDFILIGESDRRAGDLLEAFHRTICAESVPVSRMSIINAELTKLAVNTFVTTKITFANMLARICEQLQGADVDVVTRALAMDRRIGGSYLKGAVSYGGPCFPRDNLAISHLADRVGRPAVLAKATHESNRDNLTYLVELVTSLLPHGGSVGVLGLAYKPDTDVVDESVGVALMNELCSLGVDVLGYDPIASAKARQVLRAGAQLVDATATCLAACDVIVVATPSDQFRQIRSADFVNRPASSRRPVVIDCWRIVDRGAISDCADYYPLGTWVPVVPKSSAGQLVRAQA